MAVRDVPSGYDSIWRYASSWVRVYSAVIAGGTNLVEATPDGTAVFITNLGTTAVRRSVTNGDTWTAQVTPVGASIGAADPILGLAVIDSCKPALVANARWGRMKRAVFRLFLCLQFNHEYRVDLVILSSNYLFSFKNSSICR